MISIWVPVIVPPDTDVVPDSVVNVPDAGVVPPITASTVPPLISAVVATRDAIVPSAVIFDCVAPVTVAAVPLALPVTLPVKAPANAVAVNVPASLRVAAVSYTHLRAHET